MAGLTLDQMKALCAGRKNLTKAPLEDMIDEVIASRSRWPGEPERVTGGPQRLHH